MKSKTAFERRSQFYEHGKGYRPTAFFDAFVVAVFPDFVPNLWVPGPLTSINP
jgi:hypothetical protein